VWVFTRNQQYDSTATYFDTILGLTMVRVEFKKNQSSINQKILSAPSRFKCGLRSSLLAFLVNKQATEQKTDVIASSKGRRRTHIQQCSAMQVA